MINSLSFLLLITWIAITGLAVLDLCRVRTASRATRYGLALGAGFVVSCLVLNTTLILTRQLHFWPLLLVYGAASVHFVVRLIGSQAHWKLEKRDLFFVPIVIFFALVLESSRTVPFAGYDSKAIYGIKAKALLHERDLEGPLFQDTEVVHYHGDYPLGLPALMAFTGWIAEGPPVDPQGLRPSNSALDWVRRYDAIDHYMPLATFWILALALVVAGRIREVGLGAVGSTALFLLAFPVVMMFPWVGGGSWSLGGADIPLALCIGAVALAGMRALGERSVGWLALAALFAAGAAVLKRDALISLALWPVVLLLVSRVRAPRKQIEPQDSSARGQNAGWNPAWVAAASALGLALGWFATGVLRARTAGAIYDENFFAALTGVDFGVLAERLPALFDAAWEVLWKRHMGIYWLAVLLVALPIGWRFGGATRALAAWLGLYLAASLFVFWITPAHLSWHVETALPRLWCHMIVPAAFLVIEAARYLFSSGSGEPAGSALASS